MRKSDEDRVEHTDVPLDEAAMRHIKGFGSDSDLSNSPVPEEHFDGLASAELSDFATTDADHQDRTHLYSENVEEEDWEEDWEENWRED